MDKQENKADHILRLLEERPKLLNSVILRCFERGHVARNLAFMVGELEMKIALPWIQDDRSKQPHWFRHRYRIKPLQFLDVKAAEVITSQGNYGWGTASTMELIEANTPVEAREAADKALQASGWVLL